MSDENKKQEVAAEQPLSVAEEIWNEIKDKEINMFALGAQKVSDYCKPVLLEPNKCYLIYRASAVIPALEEAIGKGYVCEGIDKYAVVSRAPKKLG